MTNLTDADIIIRQGRRMEEAVAEAKAAEAQVEALTEALDLVDTPYPISVFPERTDEQRDAIFAAMRSVDKYATEWFYAHVARERGRVAREALSRVSRSEPAPPNDDQGANSANYAEIREALEVARQRHAALGLVISEGTGYGPSVGVAMAHHEGQAEILAIFEAAISGDWPEPEPLPKRLYGPEARDDRAAPPVPEEQQ